MSTSSITSEASARSDAQTIENVRDPVARRIADVLRSRSSTPKVFLIDDRENIEQAIASGVRLDSLYCTRSAATDYSAFPSAADSGLPRHILGDGVARELFGNQKLSRVFALAHAPRTPKLDDLHGTRGDIVVLDGVRLVGNIGAITRTACALGAAGIILLDSGLRTTLDRRLIRASRGLAFSLPMVVATRVEGREYLQRARISIATLSADAGNPLNTIRSVTDRLALVIGGERDGVSQDLEALANHRYSIPMAPGVESLNVSVAAGIALYEHSVG